MYKLITDDIQGITLTDLVAKITTGNPETCCIAIGKTSIYKLVFSDSTWMWLNLNISQLPFNDPCIRGDLSKYIMDKVNVGYKIYFFNSFREYLERAKDL